MNYESVKLRVVCFLTSWQADVTLQCKLCLLQFLSADVNWATHWLDLCDERLY